MPIIARLSSATAKGKKWKVVLSHPISVNNSDGTKSTKWEKLGTVQFGQEGASDYTIHKDPKRKKRYLDRHRPKKENSSKNEIWTIEGFLTPGFWSRWLLWNKPTIAESAENIKKKFKIYFV